MSQVTVIQQEIYLPTSTMIYIGKKLLYRCLKIVSNKLKDDLKYGTLDCHCLFLLCSGRINYLTQQIVIIEITTTHLGH
jgi:hypothetical protein